MSYRLTADAEDDFIRIYGYGVERYGQEQAERYARRLRDCFAFLANHPRAARLRAELHPPIRAHPAGAHIVVYQIEDGDMVTILRIPHSHSDWIND